MFEDEIIAGMQRGLKSQAEEQAINSLNSAIDYINSAIDAFEDAGMSAQADKLLNLLTKIAIKQQINDPHTNGLTPDKMVKNILDHGHPMNKSDDGLVDDLLNADVVEDPLEVSDDDKTFEDE